MERSVCKDRSDQTAMEVEHRDGSIDRCLMGCPVDLWAICWRPLSAFDGVDVGQEWHPTTTTTYDNDDYDDD